MGKQIFVGLAMWCAIGCAAEVGADAAPDGEPSQPEAFDMFAGEMPDVIVDAHAQQLAGEAFSLPTMRALVDYAIEHADDARPWLLLARDSMRSGAAGFAVIQYTSAIHADPRAADQEGVLADIVQIARTHGGVEHRKATAIILEAYGEAALSIVERELVIARDSHDAPAVARLEALRDAITG